jgi:hypothetical protein
MNPKTRTAYFSIWKKVMAVQGWDKLTKPLQDDKRRAVTSKTMQDIGAGDCDSTTRLSPAEVTALFTHLNHLARPDCLTAAKLWTDCMADYKAFNMSKQADWHEKKAYGRTGGGRLDRQRFGGRAHAVQNDFSRPLNRREAEQRLMTTRSRARAKYGRPAPAVDPAPQAQPEILVQDGIECPF